METFWRSRRAKTRKARTVGGPLRGVWLRGQDLNLRPSGYEPDELPGCSTPRGIREGVVGSGALGGPGGDHPPPPPTRHHNRGGGVHPRLGKGGGGGGHPPPPGRSPPPAPLPPRAAGGGAGDDHAGRGGRPAARPSYCWGVVSVGPSISPGYPTSPPLPPRPPTALLSPGPPRGPRHTGVFPLLGSHRRSPPPPSPPRHAGAPPAPPTGDPTPPLPPNQEPLPSLAHNPHRESAT